MRKNLSLNLLYRILNEGEDNSLVEIINFFSEEGPVSSKVISDLYQPFRFHNEQSLWFKTLEDLGQFALEVCQETYAAEVFILSSVDYNIGLDTCNDARSFRELFRRYGNVIENPDQSRKKSNLFNKFFN